MFQVPIVICLEKGRGLVNNHYRANMSVTPRFRTKKTMGIVLTWLPLVEQLSSVLGFSFIYQL